MYFVFFFNDIIQIVLHRMMNALWKRMENDKQVRKISREVTIKYINKRNKEDGKDNQGLERLIDRKSLLVHKKDEHYIN